MRHAKFYAFLAVGASMMIPSVANAQVIEEDVTEISVTEYTCDAKDHYVANWRDNWFIQLGAGANYMFTERGFGLEAPGKTFEKNRITAAYNFGFGHWFSPYLAVRVNALGGSLHWDNPTIAQPNNGWSRAKHANLNVELMWDMCNSIAGVNPNRPVSVLPYIGIGGDFTWNIYDRNDKIAAGSNIIEESFDPYITNGTLYRSNSWNLPVNAGIQFRFRLAKAVDFFLEARASFYGDNWNNCAFGNPIDVNVNALGGFSFNINGRNWRTINECDLMAQIGEANDELAALDSQKRQIESQLNSLRSNPPCQEELDKLKAQQIVSTPNQAAPMLTNVRFKINSYKITPMEEVNVYNMAEWMKNNPKEKIIVAGYADKDTGSAAYNMALSEKRANAVADMLVDKYGIDRSRITVRQFGSDEQPYPDNNDWNRIVIFTQK